MTTVVPKSNAWNAGAFLSSQLDELGLDPYEFRVYLHLCRRANDENRAWPSHATVSAVCKMSEKKVREVLISLRDKGLISIINNFRADGGKTSNSYTITGILHTPPSVPRTDTPRYHVPRVSVPRTDTPSVPRTDKGIPVIDNVPEEVPSSFVAQSAPPSNDARDAAILAESKLTQVWDAEMVETTPKETKAKRGTRLPDAWTPSAELIEWAKDKAPGVDVLKATDNFVDYWHSASGAKASKLDWAAAWRVWIRNESTRVPQRRTQPFNSNQQGVYRTPAQQAAHERGMSTANFFLDLEKELEATGALSPVVAPTLRTESRGR